MFANDETRQVSATALNILGVHAVVANLRVRHCDNLATVAGIGEDLLVAGHRRVEADFAIHFAGGSN
jgi:hypothetical protein